MEFIKKNRNYIMWAGCAIMAIALFLTFIKVKIAGEVTTIKFNDLADGKYGFDVISGWIVLIAAAVSAVLIYLKKEKYSLGSTAVALFITFYDFFKVKGNDSVKAVKLVGKVSYVAPWIVLIGAILAACPIVIDLLEEKGVIKAK